MVGHSLEGVRSGAQQDVAERALLWRHIGRQEVLFHLWKHEERKMVQSLDCCFALMNKMK